MLFDVGPFVSGGMGPVALTEQEIAAYKANQGLNLTWWECQALKTLSRVYVNEMANTRKDAPRPYISPAEMNADRRAKIAEAMSKWEKAFAVKH